jgi:hypothetical protein
MEAGSDGAAERRAPRDGPQAPAQACVAAEEMAVAPPNVRLSGIAVPTRFSPLASVPRAAARCHSLWYPLSRSASPSAAAACVLGLAFASHTGVAFVSVPVSFRGSLLSPCDCATWTSTAHSSGVRTGTCGARGAGSRAAAGRCAPEGSEAGDEGERDEDDLRQKVGALHVGHSTEGRGCACTRGGGRVECLPHHHGGHVTLRSTMLARAFSSRSSTFALHSSLCPGQAASWHSLLQ